MVKKSPKLKFVCPICGGSKADVRIKDLLKELITAKSEILSLQIRNKILLNDLLKAEQDMADVVEANQQAWADTYLELDRKEELEREPIISSRRRN